MAFSQMIAAAQAALGHIGWTVLVQGLGALGVLASVIAFQCRSHRKIMFFRTMNELLFGVQYLLLGAYTGAAMNLVGCVRNEVFARQVAHKRSTTATRVIFSVLFLAFSALTWSGGKSVLIAAAKVASTFAYGCKNTVRMRYIVLATSAVWFTYNLLVGSAAGVVCEAFTISSILVALIRIHRSGSSASTMPQPPATDQ